MDKAAIMGNDICTFCYRPCFQCVEDDCDGKMEELNAVLKLFGKLVGRYLGGGFQFFGNVEQASLKVTICEDCITLIKGFCDLYHEWKCLELRLEWKLRKLMDVMNAADKVSSRKLAFRASFNVDNVDTDEESKRFKLASRFRKNFKRKCKLHDGNRIPKILLHRKRLSEAFKTHNLYENLTNTPKVDVDDVSNEESFHLQLGWISTFAALLWLSDGFEKPTNLDIGEDTDEFLINSMENNPYPCEFSQQASPQSNLESSEVEFRSLGTAGSSDVPLFKRGGSEEQEIYEIKAKVQQNDTNSKHSTKRSKLKRGRHIQKPFRCHCCNSRRFTSYKHLLKHQRAFTHLLMRKKSLTKLRKTNKKCRMPVNKRVSNQTESNSLVEMKSNFENIGVLRPLRSRRKRNLSEVKSECESDDSIPAASTDNDDDQKWNTSSSDETFSSSNSSDWESAIEGDIYCSFCSKKCKTSTLVSHQKKCLNNPVNLQLKTKRKRRRVSLKKLSCDIDSCPERFNFQEELDNHKKLHGSFPCAFCEEKLGYAPDLALHEREHAKNIKNKEKARKKGGKFLRSCARCPYTTSQRTCYVAHYLKTHLNLPQSAMCPICKVWIAGRHTLKSHVTRIHGEERDPKSVYTCEYCPAYFLKKSQLNSHQKSHPCVKLETKFTCDPSSIQKKKVHLSTDSYHPVQFASRNLKYCDQEDCNKAFELTEDLENHQKLHGKFGCLFCPVEESYAPKLALHERTHLPSSSSQGSRKQVNCSRCSFTSRAEFQYVAHFLEIHLELPSGGVTCQICRETVADKGSLTSHFKQLHNTQGMKDEDISRCDQCPAYFQKRASVLYHKKKMHGEDPWKCVDCGKMCLNPNSLRQHRRNKHNKKESEFTFVCDVPNCERRFETNTELEWHNHTIHSSKGNYDSVVCHLCGKLLAKALLALHILHRHTANPTRAKKKQKEPKRYVCEECGKFFKVPAFLGAHKLSHSGPTSWKFSCLFCGKRCICENKLFDHLRTHTNEKVHICEYCGEEYAHAHNLRNHKNKQHDANDRPRIKNVINARVSRKGQKLPRRVWK